MLLYSNVSAGHPVRVMDWKNDGTPIRKQAGGQANGFLRVRTGVRVYIYIYIYIRHFSLSSDSSSRTTHPLPAVLPTFVIIIFFALAHFFPSFFLSVLLVP